MTDAPESAKLNLELLIKLMGMTTSANDQEALVAIRKANTVLAKFGGDWRRLLTGKVTIIEDPFTNLQTRAQKPIEPARSAPPPPPPPPPAPDMSWKQQYHANPQQYAPKPKAAPRQKRSRSPRYSSLDSLA